ncbi:IS3 family transposase [Candidatus Mycoplasma mahonii]|uniref:IS3 family transposase n=1 Tax=Candidatus Mycoplasma mahonii TaxID=3004105 RepID=UPI00357176E1
MKSECFNHLLTHNYSFDKIKIIIDDYIRWYNTKQYKVDYNEKHRLMSMLTQSKV